jgi:hypothetical protein
VLPVTFGGSPQSNGCDSQNEREKCKSSSAKRINVLPISVKEPIEASAQHNDAIGAAVILCMLLPGLISIGWILIATRRPHRGQEEKSEN